MPRALSLATPLSLLWLLSAACVTCSPTEEVERAPSGVPVHLEDFRAQGDRDGCEVTIVHREIAPPSIAQRADALTDGAWSCGHAGPVCALLIPLALVPGRTRVEDEATLRCDDMLVQTAHYGRGWLQDARVVDGRDVTYVARLELSRLWARSEEPPPSHVAIARAQLDDAGVESEPSPVPLSESLDLPALYRAAIARSCRDSPTGRARSVGEQRNCRRQLAIELAAAAPEELPRAARAWADDEALLADLMYATCVTPVGSPVGTVDRAHRAAALAALPSDVPDAVAMAALTCFMGMPTSRDGVEDDALVRRVLSGRVTRACRGDGSVVGLLPHAEALAAQLPAGCRSEIADPIREMAARLEETPADGSRAPAEEE